MKKKKHISLSTGVIYVILSAWALTTIYPIFWIILNSFKNRNEIVSNSFALPTGDLFTLSNYKQAFERIGILGAYRNSIVISGIVAVAVVLFAGMASFALVRYHFKLKNVMMTAVLAGMMFPVFATIIPVFAMEASWGIVNPSSRWLSLVSVILPLSAGNLSFAIVILTGYMKGLPIELEEAAFMEGCGPFRIFFQVIVPLTKPSFATVMIFSFLWSYNDLFTQSFFLRTPKQYSITALLNMITAQQGTNYGLMAATVTLIVVPVIIVYIFLQKYIIKGMTAGAVKG